MKIHRRDILKASVAASALQFCAKGGGAAEQAAGGSKWKQNAIFLGDRFIDWQAPYGGNDLKKCPYRSPGKVVPVIIQGVGPQVRALYQLYEETNDEKYKEAADRHAVFLLSTLHDPPTPYDNKVTVQGERLYALSTSWMYGKALSPCYEWFVQFNPDEHALDLKALALYRWLQRHRREDSYFGVGYPNGEYEDSQFSCDLGEVGTGLVGYYKVVGDQAVLDDAMGLANYFLTEHTDGSASGVWSSKVGTWLVGPWPGGGAEHFTGQQYDKTGWGWSCLVVGEFLLELRKLIQDDAMRAQIDDKCVRAFQWCIDHCQFDDGAHGMFGRDDKWVGQTAAAILLYSKLAKQQLVPAKVEVKYRPKIQRSWNWMVEHTAPDTFPEAGYIQVTGSTTTKPPENLLWMMSWTVEALLAGGVEFARKNAPPEDV